MKKTLALILAVSLLVCAVACDSGASATNPTLSTTASTTASATAQSTTQTSSTTQSSATTATTKQPQATTGTSTGTTNNGIIAAINASVAKTLAESSYSAELSSYIRMRNDGMGIDESQSSFQTLTVSGAGTDDLIFCLDRYTSSNEEGRAKEVFYKDGTYYVSDYGFKAKFPKNTETDESFDFIRDIKDVVCPIKGGSTSVTRQTADGTYYLVDIDSNKSKEYFSSIIGDLESELQQSLGNDDAEVELVMHQTTLYVSIGKDGYLMEYRPEFKMSIVLHISGVSASISVTATLGVNYAKHGIEYTPRFPESTKDFKELELPEDIPFEIFNNAFEKTNRLEDMDTTIGTNMIIYGSAAPTTVSITGRRIGMNMTTCPVWRETTKLQMPGFTQTSDIYYEGGYYYINQNGTKQKMTEDAFDELLPEDGTNEKDRLLSFGDVVDYEIELSATSAGTRQFSFVICEDSHGAETFKEKYQGNINAVILLIFGSDVPPEYNIIEAEVQASVNSDGYITYYSISYLLEFMLTETYSLPVIVSETVVFVDPGKEMTVDPPTGYEEYPEAAPETPEEPEEPEEGTEII